MADKKKQLKYRDLNANLQVEIDWFDQPELDIDEALEHYKRAEELIEQMKTYLEIAKKDFEKKKKTSSKK